MAKGSLLPENAGGGYEVPGGDYLFKSVTADTFDYNGTVNPPAPVIMLVLQSLADPSETYEVPYGVGSGEFVQPSEDKTHFVHPDGESTPQLYKPSDGVKLLKSILDAGYPHAKLEQSDDVTQFNGLKATMVPQAKNVGKTSDDKKKGKTIPIVAKIIAMPGAKATAKPTTARPTPTAAKSAAAAKPPTPTTSVTPASTPNGEPTELDIAAINAIQSIVATVPDQTITRLKLGTQVMLTLAKAKDPNMARIKSLATNAAWLTANAELGGWVFDADTVTIPL